MNTRAHIYCVSQKILGYTFINFNKILLYFYFDFLVSTIYLFMYAIHEFLNIIKKQSHGSFFL